MSSNRFDWGMLSKCEPENLDQNFKHFCGGFRQELAIACEETLARSLNTCLKEVSATCFFKRTLS